MDSFTTKKYSKGDVIIKEGDQGDKAFMINKGYIEINKKALDDKDVVIARLGPGQIFGEMCLFDNKPRSASAVALGDVELSIIDREMFFSFLDETSPQIKTIIELLLNRLRQTSSLVTLLKLEVNRQKIIEENIHKMDFPT